MRLHKCISLICCISLMLALVGCSAPEESNTPLPDSSLSGGSGFSVDAGFTPLETGSGTADSSSESESGGIVWTVTYPVTLTDQAGREVTIEKDPSTIVSNLYLSTSMLLTLGCQERLIAVEAGADQSVLYQLCAPSLLSLPQMGIGDDFDVEECAALNPDLVFLPLEQQDAANALEELGITVLLLHPETPTQLEEAIDLLGYSVNQLRQSQKMLNFSAEHFSAIDAFLNGTDEPNVYLAGSSSLLSTAASGMYQCEFISHAGGRNVAGEISGDTWTEISHEQLLEWNPDFILLASDAEYTVASVLKDSSLSGCNAIQKGQVYQFPGSLEVWDYLAPNSVLATLWLASILHPDEYYSGSYVSTATKYYETFYGFTPSADLLSIPSVEE